MTHLNEKFATSNDPANRELSIEELEAIAAGGWFSNLVHKVVHEAVTIVHDVAPVVRAAFKDILQPWKHSPPGGL